MQALLLEQAANLNIQAAEIEANWGMGGDYRILATALTGALSGNITGSGADIIQSAAVNYLQSLAVSEIKEIADSLGSETARTALQAVAACAGAAAQGNDCGTGALGASAAVVISNLIDSVNNSNASSLTAEEKQARENLVATLVTGIALAAGLDTATANTAAQIELENNNLRLVVSTAKIVAKIGSAIQKTGKVTGTQLKEIIKGEGLDIIDDARTLLDGELNYEDAIALINILSGIDLKGLNKLEIADKLGSAVSKVTKTEVKVVDAKYVPNAGGVGNMKEFFNLPFGKTVADASSKTNYQYNGNSVYKASDDIGSIQKGDNFYLDKAHNNNHIEVFSPNGEVRAVLNLDGTVNIAKTEAAKASGRRYKP